MCDYRKLAWQADGYVVECMACKSIQLAFGTTVLRMTKKAYRAFCAQVERGMKSIHNAPFPESKSFHLDTYSAGTLMVLNQQELIKLQALVEEAAFSLEMKRVLDSSKIEG